jgi:hypothetical protein
MLLQLTILIPDFGQIWWSDINSRLFEQHSMRTDLFLQKELIYLTKGNLLYSDELEGTDNPRKTDKRNFRRKPNNS